MTNKEGWESKEAVDHYSHIADVLIPGRADILSIIARLATTFLYDQPRILDLGCGSGDVTAEVLKLRPNATVYAVDSSDEMIRRTRERFRDNHNVEIVRHDLNKGVPSTLMPRKFGAVVSCFAIHHIEFNNRMGLYTGIKEVLCDEGLFVNGDRFQEESPAVSRWVFDGWIEWMVGQIRERMGKDRAFDEVRRTQVESDVRLGDKPGTLWEMREELRRAGFQHVDCLWKQYNLAVVVATKT